METIVWNHLKEVLQRFGEYFIEEARRNLLNDGSNASGTLTDSMVFNVIVDDSHYEVTVTLEDYWYYVENGRKAGKFPPLGKIEEWINVKHIVPQVGHLSNGKTYLPTVKQLAFLIGRKIAKEGTEGTGFFSRSKEDTKKYFEESIRLAIQEDIGDYVADVLTQIPRIFQ